VTNNKLDALQRKVEGLILTGGTSAAVREPGDELTPAQIYSMNVNAVVSIRTNVSSGTGFVISADGYVVSNYHVVEGGSTLQVITVDNQTYDATLIGYDQTNDVSLMKIEAEGLPYVSVGSSDELQVGDQVVAIGNALGELTATLTVGYISGKDRIVITDGTAINMIQTDASINSGNSGGPLFNIYGEVVGITTAKYTGQSNSGATIEGIGFAIPINDVFGMLEDIRDYGYVTGPYLGVSVRDVDAAVIQNYGFPAGAYVVEVLEGLSAHRAGVQAKDIIVNIGGYDVTSVNSLSRVLRKFEAGDTTTITVFRSGTQVHLEITFDEKPQPQPTEPQPTEPQQPSTEEELPWWYDYLPPFFGQG
jgi:serine protease Do